MTSPRRVLISVKYNNDQIIERSLAAYLKKLGYTTFPHEGTVDVVKRMAAPPFIAWGPLTLMAPHLMPSGRQTKPQDVAASLVRYLVEQVCSYSLIVVVWSAHYAHSFWCMLEMKAALLARKPLVVILSDYCPLSPDVRGAIRYCQCEIVEIDSDYRTSKVAAVVDHMFPTTVELANVDEVHRELYDFMAQNYREEFSSPIILPEALARYEEVARELRSADDRGQLHAAIQRLVGVDEWGWVYIEDRGQIHPAIQRLLASGKDYIDVGLRQYLESAASGVVEAPLEGWYYTYLLREILDYKFLPPAMPQRMEEYYLRRINYALTPPMQVKVESLIEDLIKECLYTREFVEHFGHLLADVRKNSGPLVANTYWELCTSRVSEST